LRHPVGRRDHGDGAQAARRHAARRGGRAGEFCLGLALALQGQERVWALAADTDGIDGVEDNAGAFVAPDTLARARAQGMKVDDYLGRNDAYGYFSALGDLVITGPTHTNVNDFRAILVLPPPARKSAASRMPARPTWTRPWKPRRRASRPGAT
jgi:hypothetical protein